MNKCTNNALDSLSGQLLAQMYKKHWNDDHNKLVHAYYLTLNKVGLNNI